MEVRKYQTVAGAVAPSQKHKACMGEICNILVFRCILLSPQVPHAFSPIFHRQWSKVSFNRSWEPEALFILHLPKRLG